MFWGLTPAVDIVEECRKHGPIVGEELNVLIVGGSDSRHVLQTIARRYRHEPVKLNFYLVEGCVEMVARQLLLLHVALQPQETLGHVQKTRVFMELYGNTLIRPFTARYLCSTADRLLQMVADEARLQEAMPNVTLEVRHKDRDYLENLLKFWGSSDEFDICLSWDRRLRKALGVRYDSKLGAFDWDLHMRFRPMGANQVCNQEYRSFRQSGVAFTWLESEVSRPNRSLACVVLPNGRRMAHCGFMGDTQTGPFVPFGLSCEDAAFVRSSNGQNAHRATDVAERNLRQLFHELEFQSGYVHRPLSDAQLGPAVILQPQAMVVDFRAVEGAAGGAAAGGKCMALPDVRIRLLSMATLKLMQHRHEYRGTFHLLYFGSVFLGQLEPQLVKHAAAEGALVMVENQRYVLSHRDKELEEFGKSVDEKVELVGGKKLPFDVKKDDYVRFIVNSDR